MIEILHYQIDSYISRLQQTTDPILQEMELYAKANNFPIIGPEAGRLLFILTKIMNAKRILELGSGYGYSAYWFASALSTDGMVYCTEFAEKNKELAYSFLQKAGLENHVKYHVGDALAYLSTTAEADFDIIFNDINKEYYPQVIKNALPKLRSGGLLITDNALWGGRVAISPQSNAATRGVDEYNRLAMQHPELITSLLPLRDGMIISLKQS